MKRIIVVSTIWILIFSPICSSLTRADDGVRSSNMAANSVSVSDAQSMTPMVSDRDSSGIMEHVMARVLDFLHLLAGDHAIDVDQALGSGQEQLVQDGVPIEGSGDLELEGDDNGWEGHLSAQQGEIDPEELEIETAENAGPVGP